MWLITMPKGHKKARNVFKWYRTVSMLGTPPPPHFFYNPRLSLCKAHPTKRWALGSRSEPQGLESDFRGGSETHGNPARRPPCDGRFVGLQACDGCRYLKRSLRFDGGVSVRNTILSAAYASLRRFLWGKL